MIQLPLLDNTEIEPSCQFWDESALFWSTEGCELAEYRPNQGYILCKCSHLTTFSCPLVPPIVVPEWSQLTWANLMAEPAGLIALLSLGAVALLMTAWGLWHDRLLDEEAIKLTYELLLATDESVDKREDKVDSYFGSLFYTRMLTTLQTTVDGFENANLTTVSTTALSILFKKHNWLSVMGRHPMSTLGSVDRIWILFTCVLVSLVTSAMFVEAQGVEESAGVWFWCCVLGWIMMMIEYIICFRPRVERFNTLFIQAVEELALKTDPSLTPQPLPRRSKLVFNYLRRQLRVPPGFRQWRLWTLWMLMGYKYFNDLCLVDFRWSQYALVRKEGTELIKQIPVEVLMTKWKDTHFEYNKRRLFGYLFMTIMGSTSAVLLLMYTLQFQLAENPSDAQQRYVITVLFIYLVYL